MDDEEGGRRKREKLKEQIEAEDDPRRVPDSRSLTRSEMYDVDLLGGPRNQNRRCRRKQKYQCRVICRRQPLANFWSTSRRPRRFFHIHISLSPILLAIAHIMSKSSLPVKAVKPKPSRPSDPSGSTSAALLERLQKLESALQGSASDPNPLLELVALARNGSPEVVHKAIWALHRVFIKLIRDDRVGGLSESGARAAVNGDEEAGRRSLDEKREAREVKAWVRDRLVEYVEVLGGLLRDSEAALRVSWLAHGTNTCSHLLTSCRPQRCLCYSRSYPLSPLRSRCPITQSSTSRTFVSCFAHSSSLPTLFAVPPAVSPPPLPRRRTRRIDYGLPSLGTRSTRPRGRSRRMWSSW